MTFVWRCFYARNVQIFSMWKSKYLPVVLTVRTHSDISALKVDVNILSVGFLITSCLIMCEKQRARSPRVFSAQWADEAALILRVLLCTKHRHNITVTCSGVCMYLMSCSLHPSHQLPLQNTTCPSKPAPALIMRHTWRPAAAAD